MEFKNGYILGLEEHFNANGAMPMHMRLRIGWGAMKIKDSIHIENWGDKAAFASTNVQPTKVQTQEEPEKIPEILKGWWSKDKQESEILKKANLGDTVYFTIETKNVEDGESISLNLAEYDYSYISDFFVPGSSRLLKDIIDPDDRRFPENEVVKTATIYNNKATIKLTLEESWETMIKDDSGDSFSLNESLLYWEIKYKNTLKSFPKSKDDYLEVGFSQRTLYIKTPMVGHNLPEFISYEGDPMLLMEFSKGFTKNKTKDKILDIATKQAEKQTKKIVFTKLKKGYMVDNNGNVYKGKRLIYEYKKMYSNSGELFENVQKGKNFGYNSGEGVTTTRGLSQYDYFAKNGKRVTLLGVVKNLGHVFDIINLTKSATKDLDSSEPLPLDLGLLSPILDLAGVLVQEQKAQMDQWLEEDVQQEIDLAKLEGLEATRKAINTWNHNKEFKWELMAVSNETANKLLQGEFETFERLDDFNRNNRTERTKIQVLYREVFNNNKEDYVYVIETIFINE